MIPYALSAMLTGACYLLSVLCRRYVCPCLNRFLVTPVSCLLAGAAYVAIVAGKQAILASFQIPQDAVYCAKLGRNRQSDWLLVIITIAAFAVVEKDIRSNT